MTLPASWTSYGFDHSIYTNTVMPFESDAEFPMAPTEKNPVGLYRKQFTVKDSMLQDNGKVYITLGGVESAYYLYVNGVEVGYSEDSYDPHTFDITDLLHAKGEKNTLAVKVFKFCDGTWLEDQDMIYDGGIFRDVYLTSTPAVHVQDYDLNYDLNDGAWLCVRPSGTEPKVKFYYGVKGASLEDADKKSTAMGEEVLAMIQKML